MTAPFGMRRGCSAATAFREVLSVTVHLVLAVVLIGEGLFLTAPT